MKTTFAEFICAEENEPIFIRVDSVLYVYGQGQKLSTFVNLTDSTQLHVKGNVEAVLRKLNVIE